MNLGETCSRDLVGVSADTPPTQVAKAMRDEHAGIMRAWLDQGTDIAGLRAEKVMSADPLVLSDVESVETAITRLRERGVRRAPVVSRRGRLVGLVSTDDLIAQVAGGLSGLARLLEQQPRRERR